MKDTFAGETLCVLAITLNINIVHTALLMTRVRVYQRCRMFREPDKSDKCCSMHVNVATGGVVCSSSPIKYSCP